MANWSQTHSQGWGDFSEGWEATINGTKFSIVVDERTGRGTLYRSAPGRASTKVKDGSVNELKRYAETLRASRPGAKDKMSASTRFKVGDKVVAQDSVQGMKKGQTYKVTDIRMQDTPWGTFVDYQLDGNRWIGNAPFVLSKVTASRPGQPEKFARATDSEIEHLLLEAESLIDDGFVSKAIPYLRRASNSVDMNTSTRIKDILESLMKEAKVRFSRPGVKDKMAVEDRFYFGKGRKERFA